MMMRVFGYVYINPSDLLFNNFRDQKETSIMSTKADFVSILPLLRLYFLDR